MWIEENVRERRTLRRVLENTDLGILYEMKFEVSKSLIRIDTARSDIEIDTI